MHGRTVLLVCLALFAATTAALRPAPGDGKDWHPDEGLWIATGKHAFETAVLERDFRATSWRAPQFGPFGAPNPVFGKLLIGASLFASGAAQRGVAYPGYGFEQGFDWPRLRESRPPAEAIRAGRRPMRFLAALGPVLLFLFLRRTLGSWKVALAAAVLLIARPLYLEQGRMAMMDVPTTVLGLAALLSVAEARLGDRPKSRVLAAGLLAGAAAATKLTGVVSLALCAVGLGMPGGREVEEERPPLSWGRLLLTAFVTFFLFNPLLYRSPVDGTLGMVEHAGNVAAYDVPEDRQLDGVFERLAALLRMGLDDGSPLHRLPAFTRILEGLAALAGLLWLLRSCLVSNRHSAIRIGSLLVALWIVGGFVTVLATTPFDWRRWYVPMEPCWAALTALGAAACLPRRWSIPS